MAAQQRDMNVRGILSSQPFSPRQIMRGFFCFNSTWRTVQSYHLKAYSLIHTHTHTWNSGDAGSVRLCALTVAVTTCLGLFCVCGMSSTLMLDQLSVCSLSPVTSSSISLSCPHTRIRQRVISHVPSRNDTKACFWKYDYRIWGCNSETILGGTCQVWPPFLKLDWISNMLLFIMLLNILKSNKEPLFAMVQTMHFHLAYGFI